MKQIWSCGGGTQSAAIAALIIQGKLPKPDYSVMADTGREKSSTWRYVYGVLQPKLSEVGVELFVVPKEKYATVDLYRNDDILMPVFTTQNGSVSKMPGYCSNEWKTRVIDRWLREQGVAASSYITWIGISTDELRRVRQGAKRYPLVFDYPMNRQACHALATEVLGTPPPLGGSACYCCPNLSDKQRIEIRDNDPEDHEKACLLDEQIRERDPHVFIHWSGKPLREVELGTPNQMELGCDSGVCFV